MVFTMQNNPPPQKKPSIKKKKVQNSSHRQRGDAKSSVSLGHWCRSEEEEVAIKHCLMTLDLA